MPRSTPKQYVGFEMQRSVIERLATLLGKAALAFAEEQQRELDATDEFDHVRWRGPNREWAQGGIDMTFKAGGAVEWRHWEVTTSAGLVYAGSGRPTTSPPDLGYFEGAAESSFEIRASGVYSEDPIGVDIRTMNGYCTATVSAPEELVRELSQDVDSILEEYVTELEVTGLHTPPFHRLHRIRR